MSSDDTRTASFPKWACGPKHWHAPWTVWHAPNVPAVVGPENAGDVGGLSYCVKQSIEDSVLSEEDSDRQDLTQWVRHPSQERGDNTPIAVELVKYTDSNNNDAWSVFVDGHRIHYTLSKFERVAYNEQNDQDHQEDLRGDGDRSKRKSCFLPSPLQPDQLLSKQSQVRPVLFSCRLEGNAKKPQRVRVKQYQVMKTNDQTTRRLVRPPNEAFSGATDIISYTVHDTTAHSIAMPYPMCVAPNPSVAVVCFNKVHLAVEEALLKAYENRRRDKLEWLRNWRQRPLERMVRYIDYGSTRLKQDALYDGIKHGDTFAEGKPDVTVYGGDAKPAVAALADELQHICDCIDEALAIEGRGNADGGEGGGIPNNVGIRMELIRFLLRERRQHKARALFDTFAFSKQPTMLAQEQAGSNISTWNNQAGLDENQRAFGVGPPLADDESEPAPDDNAVGLEATEGDTTERDISDVMSKLYDNYRTAYDSFGSGRHDIRNDYIFVYDRYGGDKTASNVLVYTEIDVEIIDDDNTVYIARFRCRIDHMNAAFAVYSGLFHDIDRFDKVCDDLRGKLSNLETPVNALSPEQIRESLGNVASQVVYMQDFLKYLKTGVNVNGGNKTDRRLFLQSPRQKLRNMHNFLNEIQFTIPWNARPMWDHEKQLLSFVRSNEANVARREFSQLVSISHVATPQFVFSDISGNFVDASYTPGTFTSQWGLRDWMRFAPYTFWLTVFQLPARWLTFVFGAGLFTTTGAASVVIVPLYATSVLLAYLIGRRIGVRPLISLIRDSNRRIAYQTLRSAFATISTVFDVGNHYREVSEQSRAALYQKAVDKQLLKLAMTEKCGDAVSRMGQAFSAVHKMAHKHLHDTSCSLFCTERFRFFTLYRMEGMDSVRHMQAMQRVFASHEWDNADNDVLTTWHLPYDVTFRIEEAIYSRRTLVKEISYIVTGSQDAHGSLYVVRRLCEQIIQSMRVQKLLCQPNNIFDGFDDEVLRELQAATDLLTTVYAKNAPAIQQSFFVTGDDPLWSCMYAGGTARLLLTHVSAFQNAQDDWSTTVREARTSYTTHRNNMDRVNTSGVDARNVYDEWKRGMADIQAEMRNTEVAEDADGTRLQELAEQYRGDLKRLAEQERQYHFELILLAQNLATQMDGTWPAVDEARQRARRKHTYEWSTEHKEHIARFASRIQLEVRKELKRQDASPLQTLHASSEAAALELESMQRLFALSVAEAPLITLVKSNHLLGERYDPKVLRYLDVVTSQAESQRVDAGGRRAQTHSQNLIDRLKLQVFWAHRRSDVHFLDSLRKIEDISDLTDALSGMRVDDKRQCLSFFCPVGCQVNSTLALKDERNMQSAVNSLVNVSNVNRWATNVLNGLTYNFIAQSTQHTVTVHGDLVKTSLGWHPFTITASVEGKDIYIYICKHHMEGHILSYNSATLTLVGAYETLRPESADTYRHPRSGLKAMCETGRIIHYNADRYKHALALALHLHPNCKTLCVRAVDDSAMGALSLIMACAMLQAETNWVLPGVTVLTTTEASVARTWQRVEQAIEVCRKCMEAGCEVVTVQELCWAFARIV